MTSESSRNDIANLSAWLVFAGVLTGFLVLRWNVLFSPLYEDQSVGFGREAEYLSRSNFDYYRLRYEEPHFMVGGTARSYMISAIPTMLAAMERATGSAATTLVTWHVVSFVLAAAVVSLVYSMLRPAIGGKASLVSTAAFLSTPMFLAQADLAGMELPLVAFGLAATWRLCQERYMAAVLLSSSAFWMKATGALVGGAVVVLLFVRRLTARPIDRARLNAAIVVGIGSLALETAALWWGDDTALFRARFAWPKAFQLPRVLLWCPDLFLLAGLVVVVASASAVRDGVRTSIRRFWSHFREGDPASTLGAMSAVVVVGSFASMAGYIFVPRYFIVPLSFLYLLLPLVLFRQSGWTRFGFVALLIILGLNVVNLRGWLYPAVAKVAGPDLDVLAIFTPRSCAFRERSLEYERDHESNVSMIRRIASQHAKDSVFLDMPHWIYLTSPFVGYTRHSPPLAYRAKDFSATIREFRDRAILLPADRELLFLWTGKSGVRVPGPGDDVEVLARDDLNPPMALVRAQRDRLPKTPEALEDWYLDRTWTPDHPLHRVLERYEFLRKTGRAQRAYDELHIARWLSREEEDPRASASVPWIASDLEVALRTTATLWGARWSLFARSGASASLEAVKDGPSAVGLKIGVGLVPPEGIVELFGPRRFVRSGDTLKIRFRFRASRQARAEVQVQRLFEPGVAFGWNKLLEVGTEWKEFEFTHSADSDEHDATLVFRFVQPQTTYELDSADFTVGAPGPRIGR